MGNFSELNRLQPPEETFDNYPKKLWEVKISFGRLELKAQQVSMLSSIICIKGALKIWNLFGNFYESCIF